MIFDPIGIAAVGLWKDQLVTVIETESNPIIGKKVGHRSVILGTSEGDETPLETTRREWEKEEAGGKLGVITILGHNTFPTTAGTHCLCIVCFCELLTAPDLTKVELIPVSDFIALPEESVRPMAKPAVTKYLNWDQMGRPASGYDELGNIPAPMLPNIIEHFAKKRVYLA
jgi:hypothetical protein